MHYHTAMITTRLLASLSRRLVVVCLLTLSTAAHAQAPSVERVEPAFWWTGMVEPTVQLMVYGPDITTARVQLDAYPGVRLTHVPGAAPSPMCSVTNA